MNGLMGVGIGKTRERSRESTVVRLRLVKKSRLRSLAEARALIPIVIRGLILIPISIRTVVSVISM
jgi:hypothetical protein